MFELPHQLGRTAFVVAVELPGTAAAFADDQRRATAGAEAGQTADATRHAVFRDLRDDLICLVDLDLVAGAQGQFLEDVHVMQVGVIDRGTVNDNIVKDAGQTHHARACDCKLQTTEGGFKEFVLPLEGDQPVLVMAGGAQRGAVFHVLLLKDQAVHGIGVLLGIHPVLLCHDLLCGKGGIQQSVWNHIKALLGQKSQLAALLRFHLSVADQVEGVELHTALPAFLRIQLPYTAGRKAAGMCIGFVQRFVEPVEAGPADHAFAAHLQRFLAGDLQRHIGHDAHGMGHIFADDTFPAAGDGLLQCAVFIAEHEGESVQLPAHDHGAAIHELQDLFVRLDLPGREHGPGMPHLRQLLQDLARHLLGRGPGKDDTGTGLQLCQLVIEQVIIPVGHDGCVVLIVGDIRLSEFCDERFHSLQHDVIVLQSVDVVVCRCGGCKHPFRPPEIGGGRCGRVVHVQ